jgi:hypothetical protein
LHLHPTRAERWLLVGAGLANEEGENICFINVIIQALWHLEPFR